MLKLKKQDEIKLEDIIYNIYNFFIKIIHVIINFSFVKNKNYLREKKRMTLNNL